MEQLVDASQVRAIGCILSHLARRRDVTCPVATLREPLDRLESGDWDWLSGRPHGDLALPRLHEVMAALNRMRGVRMSGFS